MHENEDYLVDDVEENYEIIDDTDEESEGRASKIVKLNDEDSIEIKNESTGTTSNSSGLINDLELELLGDIDYLDEFDYDFNDI